MLCVGVQERERMRERERDDCKIYQLSPQEAAWLRDVDIATSPRQSLWFRDENSSFSTQTETEIKPRPIYLHYTLPARVRPFLWKLRRSNHLKTQS